MSFKYKTHTGFEDSMRKEGQASTWYIDTGWKDNGLGKQV